MIALRGHHLLCILTYIGRGYSPAFCLNMDEIVAALGQGAAFYLVDGPDAICAPLLDRPCVDAEGTFVPHCHEARIVERDRLALEAVEALLARPLRAGHSMTLTHEAIGAMRAAFAGAPQFRRACAACNWHGLCSDIAAGGFQGVKLQARN